MAIRARSKKDMVRHKQLAWLSRRDFMLFGMASAGMLFTSPLPAKIHSSSERRLSFYNTHTGEETSAVYWADGDFVADGLQDLNRILRDHRSGDIYPIDTELLDLLYLLRDWVDSRKPFQVISGYRSPHTNAILHANSSGVANRSYHMQGMAIDIRLGDCELSHLHEAALALRSGGVGYYPGPNFIHVDVGPLRNW
jgi:uncharacterized protein YcbK (DUF882 family)